MPSLSTLQWILAAAGVVAVGIGYWRKVRPALKRYASGLDVLVGRPASVDLATGEEHDAIPHLGTALAAMREDITVLTTTVAVVADQQVRIDDHERRINALEIASVERIVTKAESASMWQAVANKDVDVIDEEPQP